MKNGRNHNEKKSQELTSRQNHSKQNKYKRVLGWESGNPPLPLEITPGDNSNQIRGRSGGGEGGGLLENKRNKNPFKKKTLRSLSFFRGRPFPLLISRVFFENYRSWKESYIRYWSARILQVQYPLFLLSFEN